MPVLRMERLETTIIPCQWAFAERHRAEIDAHFNALRKKKPALWNGRVFMLHDYTIEGSIFRGSFLEADYASFLSWRDWGRPEAGVKDCFAQGALRASDGAFLLGVMSPHTANAGQISFPCGTPDPSDVIGDTVDFERSVWRELHEETGLTR